MAKSKRPPQPEYRKTSYSDEDMLQSLLEIERLEAKIKSIMAAAMGEAGGIRKKIKAAKKRAREDLAIPGAILTASLKTRKLERQMQQVAADIPEDLAEVWVDAAGQFSMFAPEEGEEAAPTAAEAAARKNAAGVAKATAEGQAEGEAVLDELAGEAVH